MVAPYKELGRTYARAILLSQATDHPHPFPCFLVIDDHSLGTEKTQFFKYNFLSWGVF